MNTRFVMGKVNPKAYTAMINLAESLNTTDIDPKLKELIKIRASQINGCAYCIDMHTRDARKLGETEQRIYALNAWRETPFFTPEERAVLDLTESITLVAESHVPDEVYEQVKSFYSIEQISEIIMEIKTM